MALLDKIFGGGLGSLVKDVVGLFKLPPEKKAELEALIEAHTHELAVKQLELESKIADFQAREIEAASANIRAEAQSGDKFTSRARPTFMYLMYLVIGWNFILLPLIQMFSGQTLAPLELPSDMYWLFGAGYLGYTSWRSLDKGGFKWSRK